MSIRKPCINVPTATYSGREMSPLHNGISAEGYEIDTIMEGFDKVMWIVKIKNNRKVWIRNTIKTKMTHEEQPIKEEGDSDEIINTIEKEDEREISPKSVKKVTKNKETDGEEDKNVKKRTQYNIFMSYKLHILKEHYGKTKSNKEVFTEVVAEWKSSDKKSTEFKEFMEKAEGYINAK